jgi:hypothetical protein
MVLCHVVVLPVLKIIGTFTRIGASQSESLESGRWPSRLLAAATKCRIWNLAYKENTISRSLNIDFNHGVASQWRWLKDVWQKIVKSMFLQQIGKSLLA